MTRRLLPKKKIIYGCESRGDAQSPYLTRWTIFSNERCALYLHIFHRSDGEELHDHPWDFWSLILWRGYVEEKRCACAGGRCPNACCGSVTARRWVSPEGEAFGRCALCGTRLNCSNCNGVGAERKRVIPGMILRRPAEWVHRVELIDEKPAVTLVFRRNYRREWGFFTSKGWQRWKEYFEERGC